MPGQHSSEETSQRNKLGQVWFFRVLYPAGVVVSEIAIGDVGLGFDSWAGLMEHCVANGSPSLERLFGAVLSRR